ncbi:peptidase S1 [Platysternon megacephalum]|uniref:Peptidase S1 n=1 Tax=Platysternon megacephalum TaxID=55544 RepID=A0A4D9DM84_9SAUR|nr:peptidase S1 [Platysternon megacephalum]
MCGCRCTAQLSSRHPSPCSASLERARLGTNPASYVQLFGCVSGSSRRARGGWLANAPSVGLVYLSNSTGFVAELLGAVPCPERSKSWPQGNEPGGDPVRLCLSIEVSSIVGREGLVQEQCRPAELPS